MPAVNSKMIASRMRRSLIAGAMINSPTRDRLAANHQKIVDAIVSGSSLYKLSRTYGCSEPSMRSYLDRAIPNWKQMRDDAIPDTVRRMSSEGLTPGVIAQRLGIQKDRVTTILGGSQ